MTLSFDCKQNICDVAILFHCVLKIKTKHQEIYFNKILGITKNVVYEQK
jgi:hypothetical protein